MLLRRNNLPHLHSHVGGLVPQSVKLSVLWVEKKYMKLLSCPLYFVFMGGTFFLYMEICTKYLYLYFSKDNNPRLM